MERLNPEGHTGMLTANSVNVGASTFQFNSNGLVGVLFNGPVTVCVTPFTRFGGGLTSLRDLTNNPTNPFRVIGLVLKDPIQQSTSVCGAQRGGAAELRRCASN